MDQLEYKQEKQSHKNITDQQENNYSNQVKISLRTIPTKPVEIVYNMKIFEQYLMDMQKLL
ncbi:unnamed protein product [Paramecium sonneborni]|uniref:Uncharacterized protein n=1 Tax=Paramecium sonneborni TaxID=65129 RepID=A0A8S1RF68_9CILI|nr:unnamed protein product [Paramecium sonneborni]